MRLGRGGWLLAVCAVIGWAQDAEMVLQSSVVYGTMLQTRPMSEAQRSEARRWIASAREQSAAGRHGEALRSLAHGTAVMRGEEWTPGRDWAAGLRVRAEHAIVEPGQPVVLAADALYAAEPGGREMRAIAVGWKREGENEFRPLGTPAVKSLPERLPLALPEGTEGKIVLEITPEAGGTRFAARTLPVLIAAVRAPLEALAERLRKAPRRDPSADYAVEVFGRADRGEISPHRVDVAAALAAAGEMAGALEAGRDPFAGRKGELRRAYRSEVDGTLQPYRLFVPSAYPGREPSGLVVALHGMGGNEGSFFDGYDNGRIKREAERLGLLVVCPKGRGVASMYRGTAERDVLDVIAEVRREYRIDTKRIYLMGHSMGGFGTWSIAMAHPELFAALGPISGGGEPAGMVKIKAIPEYVVHGDADRTVPVERSRSMVEAGRAAGAEIEFIEVKGGGHVDIVVPQLGPMLDALARHRRP